jgi:class 3 adenylate cyclase
MDLHGWLLSLGLQQYEASFRENDIDETLLPSLTAQDLKDIGVGIVGHRRKLLNAIAALSGNTVTNGFERVSAAELSFPDTAERRQVTVMFADLVGSTALSTRLDPEDLREVISAYRKCVAETVRHLGGFVSQYLGDGVLIFFGYPQAHEDDAERAVRAALQLVAAVADLKTHAPLQTRVGIATGLVVVGEMSDAGGLRERGIVGETPNLAARLQGIAEPNSVVIAEDTRRLLGSLFELQDVGPQELKGIAGSVRAWSVLRPSSVESRFDAFHASQLTALVGAPEDPLLLFGPLWLLGRKLCGVQWRRPTRACRAIPGARREGRGDCPANARASRYGRVLSEYGKHCGMLDTLGSRARVIQTGA